MPSSGGVNDRLAAAQVKDGSFDEAHLDRAAGRVTQMILASKNNTAPHAVDFDAHHALARKAAAEGAVLLKNNAILPLGKDKSVALIGAFADAPRFQGAGSSQVNAAKLDKPLDAFVSRLGDTNVTYAQGFDADWRKPMKN